jgi:hypothetical protein
MRDDTRRTRRGGRDLQRRASFLDGVAFLGRDPAVADENLYRYCGNSPINATDPSGLRIVKLHRHIVINGDDTSGDSFTYVRVPDTWQGGNPSTESGWNEVSLEDDEKLITSLVDGATGPDRVAAENFVLQILKAKQTADDTALGTIQGDLEEHGIGPNGGRCHLWATKFLDAVDLPHGGATKCISGPFAVIVPLDPTSGWETHHIVWFKNKLTGNVVVLDDGFWGDCGSVYDPTKVSPPLLASDGQTIWNDVLSHSGSGKK